MGGVAVLGEPAAVSGWDLAGVLVAPAAGAAAVREAWDALPPGVALVLLTPDAADALADRLARGSRLVAVLP
ncbi:hypothetical protein [Actinoplanes sp. NPDC049316]|uniref:hypothetical protein n=1 Tax=Actinoplanes sp. NPDC049316 TaxID=3154727 RepID=UPI0034264D52